MGENESGYETAAMTDSNGDTKNDLFEGVEGASNGLFNEMETSENGLFEGLDEVPKNRLAKPLPKFMPKDKQDSDEDDDEDDEENDYDDDDDDDDVTAPPIDGMYDPNEYENLPVSQEVKDLFDYILRYTPQKIELDCKLKPFIPDFIPAVGDIDAFIKVQGEEQETLGLTVLDEPSAKQSDSNILELQLRSVSKQTSSRLAKIKRVANMDKEGKVVDKWIKDLAELHRSKPPPTVQYSKQMPEIDQLMQEWPSEFEDLLGDASLPSGSLHVSLTSYVDILCSLLDIPIYKSRIQALHVLFTLYSAFKNSEHFTVLADQNIMDNALKEDNFSLG